MNAFSRRGRAAQIRFRTNEAAVLAALTGELIELISPLGLADGADEIDALMAALAIGASNPAPLNDPALRRLFPDAYKGDDEASG